MQERAPQPSPEERTARRLQEHLRTTGPAPLGTVAPSALIGLVEWPPTWGGMFVSLGLLLLLSTLGAAIGIGVGAVGLAIWEAIIAIVAFFVGGWFAGRTLNVIDPLVSAAHGLLVWAVSLVFAAAFILVTTLIGISSLATAARVPLIGGLLAFVGLSAPSAPTVGAVTTVAVMSAWVTFIILLLAGIASIIGALIGNQGRLTAIPPSELSRR